MAVTAEVDHSPARAAHSPALDTRAADTRVDSLMAMVVVAGTAVDSPMAAAADIAAGPMAVVADTRAAGRRARMVAALVGRRSSAADRYMTCDIPLLYEFSNVCPLNRKQALTPDIDTHYMA
jgi:hypothetical protein